MRRIADDVVRRFAETVLGPCEAVAQPGPPMREVLRLVDRAENVWFGKRTPDRDQWAAEVRAYRKWVPAFSDQAAMLRAADADLQVLLTSAVPGRPATADSPDAHRAAGALLRRIHGSMPATHRTDALFGQMAQRLGARLRDHEALFSRGEVGFVRAQARTLAGLESQVQVPVHGDYLPRNWILDQDEGVLRVIDFARARRHVPAFDLLRLCFRAWWTRPGLAEVFLEGYGRTLDEAEVEFLRVAQVGTAVNKVCRGRELGRDGMEQLGHQRLSTLMAGQHPCLDHLQRSCSGR